MNFHIGQIVDFWVKIVDGNNTYNKYVIGIVVEITSNTISLRYRDSVTCYNLIDIVEINNECEIPS